MPKILYLVTEDFAFCSHRLPMALAAQKAGFQVGVVCRVAGHGDIIKSHGFDLYPIEWQRRSINPFRAWQEIRAIAKIYKDAQPDIVHHVALKPVIFGSIAARIAKVHAVINAMIGLGYLFISNSFKARIMRWVAVQLMRILYHPRNVYAVMQNRDDLNLLTRLKILAPKRTHLIRGSGIEVDHYAPLPEPPAPPIVFGYVGRMLKDKGVEALVDAYNIARTRISTGLILAGMPDPENPATISDTKMKEWAQLPGLEWRGQVSDIRTVWQDCHVAMLPSRREGLPKSLMEAAACERALIATDVPGCREIVVNGENGFMVPMDNANELARAMVILAEDSALRAHFAAASRRMVMSDLSADAVGTKIVALYRQALN